MPLGTPACHCTSIDDADWLCRVSVTLAVLPGAAVSSDGVALSAGAEELATETWPATFPSAASESMSSVAPPHFSSWAPAYWCSRWWLAQ